MKEPLPIIILILSCVAVIGILRVIVDWWCERRYIELRAERRRAYAVKRDLIYNGRMNMLVALFQEADLRTEVRLTDFKDHMTAAVNFMQLSAAICVDALNPPHVNMRIVEDEKFRITFDFGGAPPHAYVFVVSGDMLHALMSSREASHLMREVPIP